LGEIFCGWVLLLNPYPTFLPGVRQPRSVFSSLLRAASDKRHERQRGGGWRLHAHFCECLPGVRYLKLDSAKGVGATVFTRAANYCYQECYKDAPRANTIITGVMAHQFYFRLELRTTFFRTPCSVVVFRAMFYEVFHGMRHAPALRGWRIGVMRKSSYNPKWCSPESSNLARWFIMTR
jgi:hypothetical protein